MKEWLWNKLCAWNIRHEWGETFEKIAVGTTTTDWWPKITCQRCGRKEGWGMDTMGGGWVELK